MRRKPFLLIILAIGLASTASLAEALIDTPHDHIPDFCATPTISSVSSGSWSSASTWSPARVPTSNDRVLVSAGTTVTFNVQQTAALSCVGIHGQLVFGTTVNTRLWAGEILVYSDGYLQVGTQSQPVPPTLTAEIVIAAKALNLTSDPDQYGTGLIGWGRITMHGAAKPATFVRVAQEPRAGQTSLVLEEPVTGWRAGDALILPDTRHLKWNEVSNWSPTTPQWEERFVQSVSADGRTITLNAGLTYDHLGARDGNGTLDFLPHVGNLTRNVIIRSETPIGSAGTKGHTLFTHRATVDVRYVLFADLGRTTTAPLDNTTNHIGRYPLHAHHLMGPTTTPANGYQFTLIGNAIDGGSIAHNLKWAAAIHNSHYGLIADNVGYNYAGAIFTFEDGSESYNILEHNFAMRSHGTGDRLSEGTEGTGFWFKGPNNYIRQNVAANLWGDTTEAAYGFKFFMRFLGNINVPNFKGADTAITGQYTARDGNKLPILEFSDNEVYGAAQGLTYWWVNSQDPTPYASAQETTIRNLHIWHVFNAAVYHYPAARITFDGLVVRGKDPSSSACCGRGWHGEDYAATNIVVRNSDIQGMTTGIVPSAAGTGTQTVEYSYLRNSTNISIRTMYSANGGGWLPARHIVIRDVTFAAPPGSSFNSIDMSWNVTSQSNTTQLDEVLVYTYQGNPNDNFRTYYTIQGTQSVAGGRAPCTSTRPEIDGIVCPISTEPGGSPPAAPSNLQLSQLP